MYVLEGEENLSELAFLRKFFLLVKKSGTAPIDNERAELTRDVSISSPLPVKFLEFIAAKIPIAVLRPVV